MNKKDLNEILVDAAREGDIEAVKKALDNGADVDAKDKWGITALIWASGYGQPEIVKLLLDNGANIDAKDKWGNNALTWASGYGHTEIVKLLNNHQQEKRLRKEKL